MVNTLNLDSSNINVYDENTTFCNLDKNANLEVDKVSDRHGELAGDGRNRKDNIDIEFNSDLGDKLGAIPIDKNRNCNLSSDSITERFAERIIDNPLGRDILSDDDMIREERSSFNLDIGKYELSFYYSARQSNHYDTKYILNVTIGKTNIVSNLTANPAVWNEKKTSFFISNVGKYDLSFIEFAI